MEPLPQSRAAIDVVREHQMSLGGAVMTPEAVAAHMEKAFGGSAKQETKMVPFVLQAEQVETTGKKGRGKAKAKVVNADSPAPNLLLEYVVKLEGGVPITIPEYAHLVKIDGETLILGFPISNKSRFKPQRSAELTINTKQGNLNCFCTGIHSDVPEWGISLSIYLILQ